MGIPTWAEDVLLPFSTLSVIDLINHPLPPVENQIVLNPSDPSFFSSTPTAIEDARSARLLLSLPVPTQVSLEMAQGHVKNAEVEGKNSFLLPGVGLRMPFWALEVWEILHGVNRSQRKWKAAIKFLEGERNVDALSILHAIPWDTRLPPCMGSDVDLLTWYCSKQWLSDLHMEQMGTLLHHRLLSEGIKTVSALSVFDMSNLIRAHRYAKETYFTSQSTHHLRTLGDQLSTQVTTLVVAYVCVSLKMGGSVLPSMSDDDIGNHWVSLIVDICGGCVWVGDSKGHPMPRELMTVLIWWLKNHGISEVIEEKMMECTIQADMFSCSVLCHNALEHHFFPSDIPLIRAEDALHERVHILGRIVSYLKSVVSTHNDLS